MQRLIKINEYVAADNQVHLAEDAVGHQIVMRESHILLQGLVEFGGAIAGVEIVGKGSLAVSLVIVERIFFHLPHGH